MMALGFGNDQDTHSVKVVDRAGAVSTLGSIRKICEKDESDCDCVHFGRSDLSMVRLVFCFYCQVIFLLFAEDHSITYTS